MPDPSTVERAAAIGAAIARARHHAALSQSDLADLVNTTQSHVSRWETGAVEAGLDVLVRLAGALGGSLYVDLGEGASVCVAFTKT